MNIFKTINAIVQNIAKFIAFGAGLTLTIIIWILGRINAFVMIAIGISVWALYKFALLFNKMINWIRWCPEKVAVQCFLFALDISPAEHEAQLAEAEETLEKEKYLTSMAEKAAARASAEVARFDARFGDDEEAKNDPS